MNAAKEQKMIESVIHTAPAAEAGVQLQKLVRSCRRMFPNPTLMFARTTDTRPVNRPVSMMLNHTTQLGVAPEPP